jgi:hypothetical protein
MYLHVLHVMCVFATNYENGHSTSMKYVNLCLYILVHFNYYTLASILYNPIPLWDTFLHWDYGQLVS